MFKTTDDDLHRAVKAEAFSRGQTVTAFVEEALRAALKVPRVTQEAAESLRDELAPQKVQTSGARFAAPLGPPQLPKPSGPPQRVTGLAGVPGPIRQAGLQRSYEPISKAHSARSGK